MVTSAATATAEAGVAFNYVITATNSPTSFSVVSLPSGLSLNTNTGIISGSPALNTGDPLHPVPISLRAINAGGNGPVFTLALRILYNPTLARDITLRIVDPGAVASDVQAEQSSATVYSGLNQTTHNVQAIDKGVDTLISFPPGGVN